MNNKIFLLLFFLGIASSVAAQICDGNLGENIFPDGDFGSGVINILPTNPQIAPGYGYATDPPPIDGNYCITNNTSSWGSFARNWVDIGDNSDDPNGYMMVVNASYQPGLFYSKEITDLCENTVYVFSVDVHNLIAAGAIKPNVSFLLDGEIVYESGDVPTNQMWNTYGFTFTTEPNQTSIILSLQNNAPGGGGNDLALDNISFRACGPEAYIEPDELTRTCEDDSPVMLTANIVGEEFDDPKIQWQVSQDDGLTWQDIPGETNMSYASPNTDGGYFLYRFVLSDGLANLTNPFCRVVSQEKTIHVVPKYYSIIDTLCQGLSYQMGNQSHSTTGVFEDSLISIYGCDSIVNLDLTILEDPNLQAEWNAIDPSCFDREDGSIIIDTILNGFAPYQLSINEKEYQGKELLNVAAGQYTYHIKDRYGCTLDTTISLSNPTPFIVDLGEGINIELGEGININAQFSEPVNSTIWTSADNIICDSLCEKISMLPTSSADIILTAQSESSGCWSSDSIKINVEDVRKIYIPNAFSPNRDGINDLLMVYGSSPNVKEIKNFSVFDRWGSMLYQATDFEPNDSASAWNGNFNGKLAPAGIYTYSVNVLFLDDQVLNFKGNISLFR